VLAVWIGLYPKPFFAYIEAPIERLLHEQVNPVLEAYDVPVSLPPEGEALAEQAPGEEPVAPAAATAEAALEE
jgi:hypothetical protein